MPNPTRHTNRRNRIVIAAFAVAGLVFLVSPFAIRWWMTQDLCPTEIISHGRTGGTDWEIARSECGPEVGVVWQVRIIPTKGVSTPVYDARGGPEPIGYEQSGFDARVFLATPPEGSTETVIPIRLDMKGQAIAPVRFIDGKRKD